MTRKVLIVDDEADVRATISMLLCKACEVLQAANGEGAIKIIKKERPAIVLLDVSMPGMNGFEVLKAAKAVDAGMVIIMVTGEKDIEKAQQALNTGANEYITKPFDADYLRNEIQRLVSMPNERKEEGVYRPWRIVS